MMKKRESDIKPARQYCHDMTKKTTPVSVERSEERIDRTEVLERTSPLWLLLVEDDPGDQMLAREIVEATGLNVRMTMIKDGEKAVRCIESWSHSNRPDLVLLDINIPKKDAREVLELIRSKDRTVRVAALTGFDRQSDIAREWEGWVDGYIVKPIGLEELDQTAEELRTMLQSIPEK